MGEFSGTFLEFLGEFFKGFFGGMFMEEFLGRIFLGGFFGRNSLFTLLKLFEMKGIDLFVKICLKAEGRKEGRNNFRSLIVRVQAYRT